MRDANTANRQSDFESNALVYIDDLYRLAFSRLGNASDAQDAVQEAYLSAFKSYSTFRSETSIKVWLVRILINKINDFGRRNVRRLPTVDLSEMSDSQSPRSSSVESVLCEQEIDPLLMDALNQLGENLLTPLLLRELQGASYEEIAATLEIPLGTVMSRLHRARSALRKTLLNEDTAGNLSHFPRKNASNSNCGDSK